MSAFDDLDDEGKKERLLLLGRMNPHYNRNNSIENITLLFFNSAIQNGCAKDAFFKYTPIREEVWIFTLFDFDTYYGSLELPPYHTKFCAEYHIKNSMKLIKKVDYHKNFKNYTHFVDSYFGSNDQRKEYINQLSMIAMNSGPWVDAHTQSMFRNKAITVSKIGDTRLFKFIDSAKKREFIVDLTGVELVTGLNRYQRVYKALLNSEIVIIFPKLWY